MADPMEEAKREAEADAADERLNRFMESLGGTASAKAVFGEPVEKDGVTIVPVARVRYGGGGGGGRGRGRKKKGDAGDADQVGFGHGGGVQAAPVGYIELSGGRGHVQAHRRPGTPHGCRVALPARGGDRGRHRGALVAAQVAGLRSPRQPRATGRRPASSTFTQHRKQRRRARGTRRRSCARQNLLSTASRWPPAPAF